MAFSEQSFLQVKELLKILSQPGDKNTATSRAESFLRQLPKSKNPLNTLREMLPHVDIKEDRLFIMYLHENKSQIPRRLTNLGLAQREELSGVIQRAGVPESAKEATQAEASITTAEPEAAVQEANQPTPSQNQASPSVSPITPIPPTSPAPRVVINQPPMQSREEEKAKEQQEEGQEAEKPAEEVKPEQEAGETVPEENQSQPEKAKPGAQPAAPEEKPSPEQAEPVKEAEPAQNEPAPPSEENAGTMVSQAELNEGNTQGPTSPQVPKIPVGGVPTMPSIVEAETKKKGESGKPEERAGSGANVKHAEKPENPVTQAPERVAEQGPETPSKMQSILEKEAGETHRPKEQQPHEEPRQKAISQTEAGRPGKEPVSVARNEEPGPSRENQPSAKGEPAPSMRSEKGFPQSPQLPHIPPTSQPSISATPTPQARPASQAPTSPSSSKPFTSKINPQALKASFKSPYALKNIVSNLGSKIGTLLKRSLTGGRIFSGLSILGGGILGARFGGAVGALTGATSGGFASYFLRNTNSGNKILRQLGNRAGQGVQFLTSPQGGFRGGFGGFSPGKFPGFARARSLNFSSIKKAAGSAGKKGLLLFLLGILIIGGIVGGIVMSNPTGQPVNTGVPGTTYGLDYTLPLKDPTIVPQDIREQVRVVFPGAKLEYWENIKSRSIATGLNPAIALALWIEETGASQTTIKANGGSEIPTASGALSLGHIGCAPWENQTIDESLNCLFKFGAKYTNDQFPKFMADYSGGPASDPFSNNPNFTTNVKHWYSLLVPSGAGAIQSIITNPIISGQFVYYCQKDPRWASFTYETETLGYAGCGPTSLAMVLASNNQNYDPPKTATTLANNNYAIPNQGTAMESALQSSTFMTSLKLQAERSLTTGGSLDLQQAASFIARGYLIIGSTDNFPLCNCGHIFVVQSVDASKRTVVIRDPINCSSAGTENATNREYSSGAFPWKYAYPVKGVE